MDNSDFHVLSNPFPKQNSYIKEDHVRCYGQDYIERLRDSGFTVKVTKVGDLANNYESERMGLTQARGEIYYCTK